MRQHREGGRDVSEPERLDRGALGDQDYSPTTTEITDLCTNGKGKNKRSSHASSFPTDRLDVYLILAHRKHAVSLIMHPQPHESTSGLHPKPLPRASCRLRTICCRTKKVFDNFFFRHSVEVHDGYCGDRTSSRRLGIIESFKEAFREQACKCL